MPTLLVVLCIGMSGYQLSMREPQQAFGWAFGGLVYLLVREKAIGAKG